MSRWIAILAVLASPPALARADDDVSAEDERAARRLYQKGLAAFEHERWDEAIEAFLEAQERAPAPALHYNIAQAYRLKGDCEKALVEYKRFLREDPESPNRKRVLVRVAEMQRCSGRAGRGQEPPEDRPDPGDDVGEGEGEEPRRLDMDGEEEDPLLDPEANPRGTPPGRKKKIAGWISIGVGVALVGGGYVLGQRAASREREIDELFAQGGMWSDAYSNLEKDGRNAAVMSAVAYTAGVAAVATGAVLVYLGGKDTERLSVAPMAGRGTRGVSLGWQF